MPGCAGDRPVGVAEGVAGHGGDGERLRDQRPGRRPAAPLSTEGRALHERFVEAIDDDLDMPVALALLREILRAPIADDERRWLILDADLVLGLDLDLVWADGTAEAEPDDPVPEAAAALLVARDDARAAKDYATCRCHPR